MNDPRGPLWPSGPSGVNSMVGVLRVNQVEPDGLRTFQRRFIREAFKPGIDTACWSAPRGNGKTWLAAYILTRCLTPGDPFFVAGAEFLLCAASIEQARLCFRMLRRNLGENTGYRYLDSVTRIGITHAASMTRLRVLSSNGKTGMGIVGCPVLVADEPGSWEVVGGQLMWDAITTAQGKPGSPMRVIIVGTLAPAESGWWHEMISDGSNGSTYVQALQGDAERWDQWPEIRRVNPLTAISADFRKRLIEERDKARLDTRLKARFLSYRLNVPCADEAETLLTVDDFELAIGRPVPEREGRPIVGVDLGAGRAFSAAVGMWRSGRVEAIAVAPGLPSLSDQETRDRAGKGTYAKLVESGQLMVAEGLRVQPPAALWEAIKTRWGVPINIIMDRFKLDEMRDAVKGACTIEPRIPRWSESTLDIQALRRLVRDGPLAIAEESRPLIAASLSVTMVKNDDAGNVRMIKKGTNNCGRDDVSAALIWVSGGYARAEMRPVPTVTHVVSRR